MKPHIKQLQDVRPADIADLTHGLLVSFFINTV